MKNPWLHRLAIVLAVCTLLLIVDGAMIGPGTQATPAAISTHRIAATVVSLLALGLVLWLVFTDSRPQARRLGWLTLALAVLQDSVGHGAVLTKFPMTAGIAHALMAPLFFAAVVAIAVVTSPAWYRGHEHVSDYGWPSMRSLAILTPILVMLQIFLGAAFRQKVLTLLPHVLAQCSWRSRFLWSRYSFCSSSPRTARCARPPKRYWASRSAKCSSALPR